MSLIKRNDKKQGIGTQVAYAGENIKKIAVLAMI